MIKILFSEPLFYVFLAIVLVIVSLIKRKKFQEIFLIVFSLGVYYYLANYYIVLLLFSITFNYIMGNMIFRKKNKIYLLFGIAANVLLLVFFKYTDFIIQTLNGFSGQNIRFLNLLLPIGISFYTFRILSYLIDINAKKIKPSKSLLDFALYISFFPYILAGPITRAITFLPQIKKIMISGNDFKAGITLIAIGLIKKLVFADNIAVFSNDFLNNPNAFNGAIFLGIFAFGIQLYCDFSGYSDIAIGIARLFGYKLGLNFDYPYFAKDISTFWKKWHITLSSWLRDYVYIPLGGSRKGRLWTYFNLIVTMLIAGIWHGASWTFIIWGLYFGFGLAVHRLLKHWKINDLLNILGNARNIFSLLMTQVFVFFGWLFFSAKSISDMFFMTKNFFTLSSFSLSLVFAKHSIPMLFLFLFVILHIYSYLDKGVFKKIEETDLFYWTLFLFVVFLALFFLSTGMSSQFIYTQF